jgi:hypothetical protein
MALPHKTGLAWAQFSDDVLFDDVLEAVEIVPTGAIEGPCRPT